MAADSSRVVLIGGANASHPMDVKGRVSFPAKFRKLLPDELVVVLSPLEEFPSLWIYSSEEYGDWVESVIDSKQLEMDDEDLYFYRTALYAQPATLQPIDQAGRIHIPVDLRRAALLGKTVKIIGAGSHLEVWDEEIYARYLKANTDRLKILVKH
jgi:MraZ protein